MSSYDWCGSWCWTRYQTESTHLTFNGFCRYFEDAAHHRVDDVWSAILVHQYLPTLKPVDHRYGEGSILEFIAKHKDYEVMITKLFDMLRAQETPNRNLFDFFME